MTADLLLWALLHAQLAAGFAILLVLALRRPARTLIGPELAYRLWIIAPVAAVVSLFPNMPAFLEGWGDPRGRVTGFRDFPFAEAALAVWAVGALCAAGLMVFSEVRFRRLAALGLAGPAVMGLSWPRIVTPADYAVRFTEAERALIDRHERANIARRDPQDNLYIAAMQVLAWFNPLVHVAAGCARLDQELACDAAVIQALPARRRDYGATLLKAHLSSPSSPLACTWLAGGHPLELRLTMLAKRPLTISHYLRGAAAVGVMAVVVAGAVWAGG